MTGILYLCGTPVGNLEDITARAARILNEVDIIACEDTRHTIKLLNHLGISKKLISYHEHNENQRAAEITVLLQEGKNIALVSDAGTPVISDPGHTLVKAVVEAGIGIIPVPGPSAFLLALIASGLDCSRFVFEGFLPREKGKRINLLESLKAESRTIVFYESPHRIKNTLQELYEIFSERQVCIARELTKKFEQFWRGPLSNAIDYYAAHEPRGEFCLVIEGKITTDFDEELYIKRIEELLREGRSKKDISKLIAKEFNLNSKKIYEQLVQKVYKL